MDHTLQLYDPDEEKAFEIKLTKEDYERALNDLSYAQSLLNRVMLEEKHQATSEENYEAIPQENSEASASSETQPEINDDSSSERNVWSYSATLALLNSMETHFEDMNLATKKKYVFSNVSNDLLSLGHKYDEYACNTKWKTLVRSYKNVKDKKGKTGRAPSRFMFFDLMDNILGDKPTNKCLHSLESSESSLCSMSSDSYFLSTV